MSDIIKDAEKRWGQRSTMPARSSRLFAPGVLTPPCLTNSWSSTTVPPTPLQQLASFQVPEARTVLIAPFDKSCVNDVEKAIRDSDLGVNPSNDGNVVRCVLPALTEERRKEYIKMAKTKAEEGRIAVRNVRRASNDVVKKQEKDKEISEDEMTRLEKELDQVTRKYVEQIDELLKSKESELLEI